MTYTSLCMSHGPAAMDTQKQSSSGAKAEANISRVLCPAHPCFPPSMLCNLPLHAVQHRSFIEMAAALAPMLARGMKVGFNISYGLSGMHISGGHHII